MLTRYVCAFSRACVRACVHVRACAQCVGQWLDGCEMDVCMISRYVEGTIVCVCAVVLCFVCERDRTRYHTQCTWPWHLTNLRQVWNLDIGLFLNSYIDHLRKDKALMGCIKHEIYKCTRWFWICAPWHALLDTKMHRWILIAPRYQIVLMNFDCFQVSKCIDEFWMVQRVASFLCMIRRHITPSSRLTVELFSHRPLDGRMHTGPATYYNTTEVNFSNLIESVLGASHISCNFPHKG